MVVRTWKDYLFFWLITILLCFVYLWKAPSATPSKKQIGSATGVAEFRYSDVGTYKLKFNGALMEEGSCLYIKVDPFTVERVD